MSRREEDRIVETGFPFVDAFNPLEQQENQQKDGQINNFGISINDKIQSKKFRVRVFSNFGKLE